MNWPFIIFLILILLASPSLSNGEVELKQGEEIDQIDYRGPETHTFIPPPRSKFGPHKSSHKLDAKYKALQSAHPLGRKGAFRDIGKAIPPKS